MATLMLKRADICADCGRKWMAGARARWFPKVGVLCADKADCALYRANVERWRAESAPQTVETPAFNVPQSVQRRRLARGQGRCAVNASRVVRWNAFLHRPITRWDASGPAAFASLDGRTRFYLTRNGDGRPYAWRVSRFDASGEAIGHAYGRDPNEALRNGMDGWGEVRLLA